MRGARETNPSTLFFHSTRFTASELRASLTNHHMSGPEKRAREEEAEEAVTAAAAGAAPPGAHETPTLLDVA